MQTDGCGKKKRKKGGRGECQEEGSDNKDCSSKPEGDSELLLTATVQQLKAREQELEGQLQDARKNLRTEKGSHQRLKDQVRNVFMILIKYTQM